ncbi:MAG: tetratricopeptide repeat protein [Methanosarcinales archaeon]
MEELGKIEEAINCYNRALEIEPDYNEAKEGLNRCKG